MALTPKELDIARQIKEQGGSKDDFMEVLTQFRQSQPKAEPIQEPIQTQEPLASTEVSPALDNTQDQGALGSIAAAAVNTSNVLGSVGPVVEDFGAKIKTREDTSGFRKFIEKTAVNVPGDLVEAAGGFADIVGNPIDSTKGIFNLGQGISDKVVFSFLNAISGKDVEDTKKGQIVDMVGEELKKNFGTVEAAKKTISENPIDAVGFVGSIIKKASKLGGLSKSEQKKVDKLTKEAAIGVEQFVKPTKDTTKSITKKITPTILKKEIKGTREEVIDLADTKVTEIGKELDNFILSGKVEGKISLDKLIDTLADADGKLRFEGEIIPGREAQAKFIEAQVDFLGKMQKKFGDTLSPEQQIVLRRSFDEVFDKTITRDKITKFQDDLQVKLADTLRTELSKNNPELDKINKDISFYLDLQTVMSKTDLRTTGQDAQGLLNRITSGQQGGAGAAIGAAVGGSVGGVPGAFAGAIAGGVIGSKLQSVVSNPKWKLVSAQKKSKLAEAIANQDRTKVENILDSMVATQIINPIKEEE